MKYQPQKIKSLITQLNADLPNIITCLHHMEIRLRFLSQVADSNLKADKAIANFIKANPDYEIELKSNG